MKKQILLSFIILLVLSSCHLTVVEEPHVHVDVRDRFLGVFEVEEYSETFDAYSYYHIDIVALHGEPYSVILRNFYGADIDVIADVEGNYLYIPSQDVGGFHIEGEGSVSGNRLELSYYVHDYLAYRDITDHCHSVAWR
ncbi:hypothetical protein LVD17_23865 [Fulvivirga ulvae]|uniref:hypothetical protein n=1 Tax=Fulvivirga ulvae TaxID=2904245 RepID=UPI001F3ABC37|nr:hypothetical protein [Fulvivirga ulvae]UII31333.1 hypothetical protein LVD17_23865 [Fulvivirga ulvae]